MANLVIITGESGVGKTTFANWLSEALNVKLISVDYINETIYEILGYKDREEKRKLRDISFNLMYSLLKEQFRRKSDIIIEYPFGHETKEEISKIVNDSNVNVITIRFECPIEKSYVRAVERDATDNTRHITHFASSYPNKLNFENRVSHSFEYYKRRAETRGVFNFDLGRLITVDASDLSNMNTGFYNELLVRIKSEWV